LILYRVSNHTDLTGKGGELADGRWHTRQLGRRTVYLSDHPALCLLEILVHVPDKNSLPDSYQLLSVDVPDVLIERIPSGALPNGWETDISVTQAFGNNWLNSRKGALLVPSVVVPSARNCLLNGAAPEIRALNLEIIGRFPFDKRLA
jgi:RES domain-containing protein